MLKDTELKLYHREVYWEDWFDKGSMDIISHTERLSPHLEQRLTQSDKSHDYDIKGLYLAFKSIKGMDNVKPFEVGTDLSGNVLKCVVRTKYNDTADICIVFRKFDANTYMIKTAWLCETNDNHITLDTTKYKRG